jgi:hypothetical protein
MSHPLLRMFAASIAADHGFDSSYFDGNPSAYRTVLKAIMTEPMGPRVELRCSCAEFQW